jgi:malate synthase
MQMQATTKKSVQILGAMRPGYEAILTPQALAFIVDLEWKFDAERRRLLALRNERQVRLAAGAKPDFLPETRAIRDGDWTVAPLPKDLLDRRVEITGPPDRKMVINALNSGASCFMADFEDSCTPTWANLIEGQINLRDAVAGTIGFSDPASGKQYKLNEETAVLLVRPRGWHLPEKHVVVDGRPMSGSLCDFGLYVFHNAKALVAKGSGPYFYLPKMESHLEARLWDDVITHTEEALDIGHGTVRATVLIETIPAAFEMDEILYELRDHCSGLNAGRWDYLFSIIKNLRDAPGDHTLPDRNAVTMNAPMMRAYCDLLVSTCHRRGAFAMGGMAAFIPSRRDAAVNEAAFAKVREDKTREARQGFDGSWVAHPDLVPLCVEIFDELMPTPNQLSLQRDVHVTADDLLDVASTPGSRTLEGLRTNVEVGITYVAAWLGGNGAAAIHNLMEDAATAEISRSQIWQWVHSSAVLEDGTVVDRSLVERVVAEEYGALVAAAAPYGAQLQVARDLFLATALDDEFADFLTLPAYDEVLRTGG